jgi:ABC-type multidrug transport system fused ATPase/permease subunit
VFSIGRACLFGARSTRATLTPFVSPHRNEVDVPDDLRQALLGETITKEMEDDVEGGAKPNILASLLSSRASELNDMEEGGLMKEIRTVYEKLWGENNLRKYECRVVDGSYSVTNTFEEDIDMPSMQRRHADDAAEEEAGPPRATQRIETVATASPVNKIIGRAIRSVYTKGHAMKTETKVIVDDLNVRLEAGKMYLVLGLPGSGKSSLLKIIANTLRQDAKHVVGGEVTVNGISTKDKEVVWSVSATVAVKCLSCMCGSRRYR